MKRLCVALPDTLFMIKGCPNFYYRDLLSANNKLIIAIDGRTCLNCQLLHLIGWADNYKSYLNNNTRFFAVITTQDLQTVQEFIKIYKLDFPVILDVNELFIKHPLPQNETLRTFLTVHDRISVMGSPLIYKNLRKKYFKLIQKTR